MVLDYQTRGTCSRSIHVEVNDDDVITNVSFVGGCNGNLKGISQLVVGMKRTDAIAKLKGITCGMKQTSCPDQLACALEKMK